MIRLNILIHEIFDSLELKVRITVIIVISFIMNTLKYKNINDSLKNRLQTFYKDYAEVLKNESRELNLFPMKINCFSKLV